MSIWASEPGERDWDVPTHENYSGELDGRTFFLDVATAPSFHNRVRLTVGDLEIVIRAEDALDLAARLARAASRTTDA